MSIERIHSLYNVSLLGMDNVESCARSGKSWRKIPVALCMTEVRCLVNRSLESRCLPTGRETEIIDIHSCYLPIHIRSKNKLVNKNVYTRLKMITFYKLTCHGRLQLLYYTVILIRFEHLVLRNLLCYLIT